jgi:anti-anti-sigma factor
MFDMIGLFKAGGRPPNQQRCSPVVREGTRNKESVVVVENDRRITMSTQVSADLLEPFTSGDATLEVARVVDEEQRYALFVLHGELTEGTAPQLLEHLVAAARRPAVDLVIVDLSQVISLGAAGANCLEAAWRAAKRLDAQVVASRPSPFARQVLEAAGLSELLEHEPPLEDASDPRFDPAPAWN